MIPLHSNGIAVYFTGLYLNTMYVNFVDDVCLSFTENIDNSKIKISFTWPNTIFHQTADIQCPCPAWPQFTKGLHAFKVCGEHGSWERTILDNCIFSNDVDNLCLGVSYPIMKMSCYYHTCYLPYMYRTILMSSVAFQI